jgi:hypothetical protein
LTLERASPILAAVPRATATSAAWRYLRRHHLGLLALVIALSGSAYAVTALPRGSVGSVQIRDGAVARRDLAPALARAITPARAGVAGPAGARGEAGPPGPRGEVGPPGPAATLAGVPAGGALAGTYPNPSLAPGDPLHVIGAPGEPAFATSPAPWRAYGGGFAPPAFFRDRSGVVHLTGLACIEDVLTPGDQCYGGTFTLPDVPIVVLPPGHRPAERLLFVQASFHGNGPAHLRTRVDVLPDGRVLAYGDANSPGAIGGAFMTLTGISFPSAG